MSATLNEQGVKELSMWLLKNHKSGKEIISSATLGLWAEELECEIASGRAGIIEIDDEYSVSGHAESLEIGAECFDYSED